MEAVKNSSNELNMKFALKFILQIAFIYIQESTRKFVKTVKGETVAKTRQKGKNNFLIFRPDFIAK